MKGLILILAVAAALLFAGCASGPQISTAPAPTVPPVVLPAKNVTAPPAPPMPIAPPVENVTLPVENTTPQMSPDSCIVEFQKDASSVYFVMVKTASEKTLTVQCPNGDMAVLKGQLWFCENLAVPAEATAYLDGKACGSAQFQRQNAVNSPISCSVNVAPSGILAGKQATVTVTTSTGDQQVSVSYTCGDAGEKTQSRSGLVTDGSICTFSQPGEIEIDAKINGNICASTMLQVYSTPKDCSVFGSTYDSKNGVYTYTAQLAARGYSSEDSIIYYCYSTSNQQPVGSMQNSTNFITTIKCSGNTPLTEAVKVKVGSDECGYIEVPSAQ